MNSQLGKSAVKQATVSKGEVHVAMAWLNL